MRVSHGCGKQHEVFLGDDGTLDTVVEVDGQEVRFAEADRDLNGCVRATWLRRVAIEACEDGLLQEEAK